MKKLFKCPFCNKNYLSKEALYNHMEDEHEKELCGLPAAQVYFNYRNKYALTKSFGKSVILGKPTKFNLTTERYERFADDNEKKLYREQFRNNMIKKYGKDTLLDDPEQQKLMLKNRHISGEFTWDDGSKTIYTGSYEKSFLEFLNFTYNWDKPSDVIAPSPIIIDYTDSTGRERFHIPDFYIQSLNLLINIKSSTNMGYRLRDIEDEKLEDAAIKKTSYNYIKIYDNDFKKFSKVLDYFKSLDANEKPKRIFIV